MGDEKEGAKWKDWTNAGAGKEWKDAFYSFTNDQEKAKEAVTEVDASHSWRELEWDEKREESARLVVQQETEQLTAEERDTYEVKAAGFWDEFYEKHNSQFFKQRNYLPNEFPELVYTQALVEGQPKKIVVELGCGNGSSFFPLVEQYQPLDPRPLVYGLDFSATAIDHIKVCN